MTDPEERSRRRPAPALAEDEFGFLRRRADEETRAARLATAPEAAMAHLRFTAAYRARLAAAESREAAGAAAS